MNGHPAELPAAEQLPPWFVTPFGEEIARIVVSGAGKRRGCAVWRSLHHLYQPDYFLK